jgi:sterol desaturase/sphingolipid hydroxylase (fatty acid hydroxylase superfamily)
MNDEMLGKRDKRGDWKPFKPYSYPPIFRWPLKPIAFLKWLPNYFLPWNLLYGLIALFIWIYLTPSMNSMKEFSWGWVSFIFIRNLILVVAVFGGLHFWLYIKKAQGNSFKYNSRAPSTENDAFLFGKQNLDNIIWTLGSSLPAWTLFEVVSLWLFANNYVPYVSWIDNPIYCTVILILIPIFKDLHFYLIHRALHWPPLYKLVHSLHHNSVNPAPWSGLAMHPIESLAYFSGALIHLIIPSNPFHFLFHIYSMGIAPALSHTGYERLQVGGVNMVSGGSQMHYLHHKYFECNYGVGLIPIDKWCGTFHDGTPESQAKMEERFYIKQSKINNKTVL